MWIYRYTMSDFALALGGQVFDHIDLGDDADDLAAVDDDGHVLFLEDLLDSPKGIIERYLSLQGGGGSDGWTAP